MSPLGGRSARTARRARPACARPLCPGGLKFWQAPLAPSRLLPWTLPFLHLSPLHVRINTPLLLACHPGSPRASRPSNGLADIPCSLFSPCLRLPLLHSLFTLLSSDLRSRGLACIDCSTCCLHLACLAIPLAFPMDARGAFRWTSRSVAYPIRSPLRRAASLGLLVFSRRPWTLRKLAPTAY